MYKRFLKRILDLLLALMAFPFLIVLAALIVPLIYLEDKGSGFYKSDRLGKDGNVFKMYKFRTMKMNSPDIRNSDSSTYNSDDDPRLTKVGRFLRKTSIDETPQIINVLIGNMSFIGPRPDLPEHLILYTEYEKRKLEVRPGITGYSQAFYRNSIKWKDKIKNDIFYIDHISFNLDVKIVFKTIIMVFRGSAVYVENR